MEIKSLEHIKMMQQMKISDAGRDELMENFLINKCEIEPYALTKNKTLYQEFLKHDENCKYVSFLKFCSALHKFGAQSKRKMEGTYIIGLKLKGTPAVQLPKKERKEQQVYSLDEAIKGLEDTPQD